MGHVSRAESATPRTWLSKMVLPSLSTSLTLAYFVARHIWRRRGVCPLRCRAHRLQRRGPLRSFSCRWPPSSTCDTLQERFAGHPVAVCLELNKGPLVYALRKYAFLVL